MARPIDRNIISLIILFGSCGADDLGLNAFQSLIVFLFCIHFVLEGGTLRSTISTAFENGPKTKRER